MTFMCKIDGIDVTIDVSRHAYIRLQERRINVYSVYAGIIAAGPRLLDLKNGDQFAVIDRDVDITVICQVGASAAGVSITVITVIDRSRVYLKDGTKYFVLPSSSQPKRRNHRRPRQ